VDPKRGLFVCLSCAIVGFGIVMVYSASVTSWPTEFERIYLSRQLTALGVGAVVATAFACAPAAFWRRSAPLLMAMTILLLVAVLLPGVGTRVNGAQRWLRFGRFQFQPSELAKIALTLFLCAQVERIRTGRQSLRSKDTGTASGTPGTGRVSGTLNPGGTLIPETSRTIPSSLRRTLLTIVAPVIATAGLVLAEPDLGTAVFLVGFAALALFASGWPIRYFAWAGIAVLPAAGFVAFLRPYQLRRVTGFVAAWSDWSRIPYQLEQSLVSLGAGGLWGVGLGKGWQKLSFLPEANTDFVFAVVGEELGLVGTLGLLLLWTAFYYSGLRTVADIRNDRFAATAAFVLLTQIAVQAAVNMAVVCALVPPKGIPLPLVSYGGSALVTSLASIGIFLSLSRSNGCTTGAQSEWLEFS
jgi:cell division protein FtsW